MPDHVDRYLDEIRDLRCAPLLRLLVEQVCRLDAGIEAQVGAYGVQFSRAGRTLCELSVFGELFIARVGSDQTVEYRVRNHAAALEALDRILIEIQTSPAPGPV